jgi:hypothetical protein
MGLEIEIAPHRMCSSFEMLYMDLHNKSLIIIYPSMKNFTLPIAIGPKISLLWGAPLPLA